MYLYIVVVQSGDKNYKRLTCTQSVGLKHANLVISVEKVHKVRKGFNFFTAYYFLCCKKAGKFYPHFDPVLLKV